jgi:HD-GYP domain-containing protein (c-di-GMP phosphodiesterase class II)
MFEPGIAALMAAACSVIADLAGRRPPHKTVFNAAQYVLCVGTAGLIYHAPILGYPRPTLLADIPVFAVSTLVYYLLNVGLVLTAFSLAEGRELFKVLASQARLYLFQYLSLACLGMLVSRVYGRDPLALVLFVMPIVIVYLGIRNYTELQSETKKAIEALADSIDRRDDFTFEHSLRVADYSVRTARELKLPEEVVEQIHLAARIHDLGKVGLTSRVLFKKGHLGELEWERIREHPQIGGEIAGKLKMYRNSTAILRHHHENYDGSGYPDGLAGDNIPTGARVIRVADAFDAMTTDRPYRKALSRRKAVAEIRKGMGTLFDPDVGGAFLKVLAAEKEGTAGDDSLPVGVSRG